MNDEVRRSLSYVSFFSGAGGLDLGLHAAGFRARLFCENNADAIATLRHNFSGVPIVNTIENLTKERVLQMSGLAADDVFLVAGGPPCQAFSTVGKRRSFDDVRGNVFLTFVDLALSLRPKYILIENVRGLLSAKMSDENRTLALAHIVRIIERGGYAVSFNLYDSANFGVAQRRERVILIASRDGTRVPYLTPTHCNRDQTDIFHLPEWRTFRDATSSLNEANMTSCAFRGQRLRFFRMLTEGQNWRNLPIDVQREAMGRAYDSSGGKTGFFRRLRWDSPAPTLVTCPTMPATELCHPERDRPLSIEEYKRLQQFPDDFFVCGTLIAQYRQLGNAVPVGLGRAAGLSIIAHDAGENPPNVHEQCTFSRYSNTDDVTWRRIFLPSP